VVFLGEDLVGGGGPGERLRVGVPVRDVVADAGDVGDLLRETRIPRQSERALPVRLQVVVPPQLRHVVLFQAGQPEPLVPIDPTVHSGQRHPGQCAHLFAHPAFTGPQHDPGPGRHHRRHVAAVDHRPELGHLLVRQHHQTMMDPRTSPNGATAVVAAAQWWS
jgi:hypothetical protein